MRLAKAKASAFVLKYDSAGITYFIVEASGHNRSNADIKLLTEEGKIAVSHYCGFVKNWRKSY